MKKFIVALACACGVSGVMAFPDQNLLSQCLADSTTGKDRRDLARWMVISMAQHPAMADLTTATPEQLDTVNKTTAQLYMRLLTVDCVKEFKAVAQASGELAVRGSFETLGRLAVQELMANPQVNVAVNGLAKYADRQKLNKVLSGE